MTVHRSYKKGLITAIVLLIGALAFLYAPVLGKLGSDWWSDENYSHGLLVPFVIAFTIWQQRELLSVRTSKGNTWLAWSGIGGALILLVAGTLASELFSQRVSLLMMLAAIVVYF